MSEAFLVRTEDWGFWKINLVFIVQKCQFCQALKGEVSHSCFFFFHLIPYIPAEKSRKKKHSPPHKPIRLIIKPPTPPKKKNEDKAMKEEIDIDMKESSDEDQVPVTKEEEKMDVQSPPGDETPHEESAEDETKPARQPPPAIASGVHLTEEEHKREAERWAAYWEYSMAPSRRQSTKALALSRYHSDSEDEDARDERRKKSVSGVCWVLKIFPEDLV